jgi:hypothetical protein
VSFFGTDVDYFHRGFLVEAQFSNYPFLLNNVIRSAIFAKSNTSIGGGLVAALGIIAKAHMFPAANSTLYYEQGVGQLTALEEHGFVHLPIRMIGLFAEIGRPVPTVLTKYHARYGRVVASSESVNCVFERGAGSDSRCKMRIVK